MEYFVRNPVLAVIAARAMTKVVKPKDDGQASTVAPPKNRKSVTSKKLT